MSTRPTWPLDDEAFESSGRSVPARAVGLVAGLIAVTAALCYDYWLLPADEPLAFGWTLSGLDWLFAYSLVFFAALVVGPLLGRPARLRRLVRSIVDDRRALLATAFLLSTMVLGFVGPAVYGTPDEAPAWVDENPREPAPDQPPVFFSVSESAVAYCSGPTADGRCHGTWTHPLGTTVAARDVLAFVLLGMQVTTKFLFAGAMFLVPLSIGVGVTAGTVGGRVDDVLMRYVDLQQSIPLFLAIIILLFLFGTNFWPILVVFGLLNWGSMARTIRSETLDVMTSSYVGAAASAGAGTLWTIRRHVVPNVVHTISVAVGARLSMLIVLEALLTFLGLADLVDPSYGLILTTAMDASGSQFPTTQWWSVAAVSASLAGTVVALNVAGDAYRDVLSPRD